MNTKDIFSHCFAVLLHLAFMVSYLPKKKLQTLIRLSCSSGLFDCLSSYYHFTHDLMSPITLPVKVEPVHPSFLGNVGKSERDVAEHGHGAGLPATTTSNIHQYWWNSGRKATTTSSTIKCSCRA